MYLGLYMQNELAILFTSPPVAVLNASMFLCLQKNPYGRPLRASKTVKSTSKCRWRNKRVRCNGSHCSPMFKGKSDTFHHGQSRALQSGWKLMRKHTQSRRMMRFSVMASGTAATRAIKRVTPTTVKYGNKQTSCYYNNQISSYKCEIKLEGCDYKGDRMENWRTLMILYIDDLRFPCQSSIYIACIYARCMNLPVPVQTLMVLSDVVSIKISHSRQSSRS